MNSGLDIDKMNRLDEKRFVFLFRIKETAL